MSASSECRLPLLNYLGCIMEASTGASRQDVCLLDLILGDHGRERHQCGAKVQDLWLGLPKRNLERFLKENMTSFKEEKKYSNSSDMCVYVCMYVGENKKKTEKKDSGETQREMQDIYGGVQGLGWDGGHGRRSDSKFDREMMCDLWKKFNNGNNFKNGKKEVRP